MSIECQTKLHSHIVCYSCTPFYTLVLSYTIGSNLQKVSINWQSSDFPVLFWILPSPKKKIYQYWFWLADVVGDDYYLLLKYIIAYIDVVIVYLWFAQPRGSLALTCCWFSKVGILVLLRNQTFVRCFTSCCQLSFAEENSGWSRKKGTWSLISEPMSEVTDERATLMSWEEFYKREGVRLIE